MDNDQWLCGSSLFKAIEKDGCGVAVSATCGTADA